jgi:hypothetical protein
MPKCNLMLILGKIHQLFESYGMLWLACTVPRRDVNPEKALAQRDTNAVRATAKNRSDGSVFHACPPLLSEYRLRKH